MTGHERYQSWWRTHVDVLLEAHSYGGASGILACEQGLLFGQAKRLHRSLARSREPRFTRPNIPPKLSLLLSKISQKNWGRGGQEKSDTVRHHNVNSQNKFSSIKSYDINRSWMFDRNLQQQKREGLIFYLNTYLLIWFIFSFSDTSTVSQIASAFLRAFSSRFIS